MSIAAARIGPWPRHPLPKNPCRAQLHSYSHVGGVHVLADAWRGTGAVDLVRACKRAGLKTALASSADLVKVNPTN